MCTRYVCVDLSGRFRGGGDGRSVTAEKDADAGSSGAPQPRRFSFEGLLVRGKCDYPVTPGAD